MKVLCPFFVLLCLVRCQNQCTDETTSEVTEALGECFSGTYRCVDRNCRAEWICPDLKGALECTEGVVSTCPKTSPLHRLMEALKVGNKTLCHSEDTLQSPCGGMAVEVLFCLDLNGLFKEGGIEEVCDQFPVTEFTCLAPKQPVGKPECEETYKVLEGALERFGNTLCPNTSAGSHLDGSFAFSLTLLLVILVQ